MKRQTLFTLIVPIILGAFLAASVSAMAATDAPTPTGGTAFDYAWLKGRARALAASPHVSHEGELPKALQNLTWDDYMQLSFDSEHALWQDAKSLFRAELFHLGLYFKTPITIYELEDGKVKELDYTPDLFKYGNSGIKGKDLPKNLGFAGFRFRYHTDWARDLVAFLGASYFRAVGGEMQYGLSARGLAVDTALPRDEEFPTFTHFWLEKPRPGSDTATVYALLDSPSVTGAYRFDNAASTKMVHISEFTADLIKHGKLKLDPKRNDHRIATYHDSCNPARAMGLLEEPRYVLKNVCNNFHEMPENTIRESTFCCGSGTGLNTDEIMELRMRAGLPRANAVKYVREKHEVNMLSCVCAIDRATLTSLNNYWNPDVEVCGVSELVGNALVMEGEKERETGLRFEPLAGMEG